MTTSPAKSTSTSRTPLRLTLGKAWTGKHLDGGWWPQSRDLQDEAADLVDHFPTEQGRISRLLFSRPDWDAVAGEPSRRRVQARRGVVKIGSFPRDDTHVMTLSMHSGRRLQLLVVPPDTDPTRAAELMKKAADPSNEATAAELLGTASFVRRA